MEPVARQPHVIDNGGPPPGIFWQCSIGMTEMPETTQQVFDMVVRGDRKAVAGAVELALNSGVKASKILQDGLIAAMQEVGSRFEAGQYFVPELLIAARAMQAAMDRLEPELAGAHISSTGKVVLGTVKGDLHDIGKNLVGMMLQGAGFEVIDLGTDVHPELFVEAAVKNCAQVLGMSALLTTTMKSMVETISAIERAGMRAKVKIMVGGAALSHEFASQIGADGYAPDAIHAVSLAKTWVETE